MKRVRIVEVSARDGLQAVRGAIVPTEKKMELIRRLVAAGVTHLDVASFANPKLVPQLADGAQILRQCAADPSLRDQNLTCIVPNQRGLERALAAGAGLPNLSVSLWVHATEAFSQRNMGMPISDHMRENRAMARTAAAAGVRLRTYVSGALWCPVSGPVEAARAGTLACELAALAPEVEEVVLADTLGRGLPRDVRAALLAAGSCGKPLGLHLHNTFGYALGAVAEAVESLGVRSIEGSVAGLGGCPFAGPESLGNLATDDVCGMLHQMGFETGVDVDKLVETGRWICGELNVSPASCLSRVRKGD
jgi:isopropylmalate/homocitrate/citramalate synthase